MEHLQGFGQTLVCLDRLLVVKYSLPSGNALGYGILVFDNGQEIGIPLADAKALVEDMPDKAALKVA